MTISFQYPTAWVYVDGRPIPLEWCSNCKSFHVPPIHTNAKLRPL